MLHLTPLHSSLIFSALPVPSHHQPPSIVYLCHLSWLFILQSLPVPSCASPLQNTSFRLLFKPLNFEATELHTLLIKVQNEDDLVPDVDYGPSSTATVHVRVLDINEGPAFSPNPLEVTRMENIPVGSLVASLSATDPDTRQIQSIRYSVWLREKLT